MPNTELLINVYLHSEKDTMREIGEEAGLKGEALNKFIYALYEVRFVLEVDSGTGEYRIVNVSEV